jgi:hypothetical protein
MIKKKTAGILRIIAKVIGTLVLVFFLVMLVSDAEASYESEILNGITQEYLFILIPVIIGLAAFIVAWWRELLGGILLIVAYLILSFAPSVHSIYYGSGFRFYLGMFLYSLPFLVTGILFITARLLSPRKA